MSEPRLYIGEEQQHISITFLRRAFPNADSEWDRDAIICSVDAKSLSFSGSFNTTFWSHEIANLLVLLRAVEARLGADVSASFENREGTVSFIFGLDHYGHLSISISTRPDPGATERLRFDIHGDQTLFHFLRDSLSLVLMTYPQVQPTDNFVPSVNVS